jgi:hypothetical protein
LFVCWPHVRRLRVWLASQFGMCVLASTGPLTCCEQVHVTMTKRPCTVQYACADSADVCVHTRVTYANHCLVGFGLPRLWSTRVLVSLGCGLPCQCLARQFDCMYWCPCLWGCWLVLVYPGFGLPCQPLTHQLACMYWCPCLWRCWCNVCSYRDA